MSSQREKDRWRAMDNLDRLIEFALNPAPEAIYAGPGLPHISHCIVGEYVGCVVGGLSGVYHPVLEYLPTETTVKLIAKIAHAEESLFSSNGCIEIGKKVELIVAGVNHMGHDISTVNESFSKSALRASEVFPTYIRESSLSPISDPDFLKLRQKLSLGGLSGSFLIMAEEQQFNTRGVFSFSGLIKGQSTTIRTTHPIFTTPHQQHLTLHNVHSAANLWDWGVANLLGRTSGLPQNQRLTLQCTYALPEILDHQNLSSLDLSESRNRLTGFVFSPMMRPAPLMSLSNAIANICITWTLEKPFDISVRNLLLLDPSSPLHSSPLPPLSSVSSPLEGEGEEGRVMNPGEMSLSPIPSNEHSSACSAINGYYVLQPSRSSHYFLPENLPSHLMRHIPLLFRLHEMSVNKNPEEGVWTESLVDDASFYDDSMDSLAKKVALDFMRGEERRGEERKGEEREAGEGRVPLQREDSTLEDSITQYDDTDTLWTLLKSHMSNLKFCHAVLEHIFKHLLWVLSLPDLSSFSSLSPLSHPEEPAALPRESRRARHSHRESMRKTGLPKSKGVLPSDEWKKQIDSSFSHWIPNVRKSNNTLLGEIFSQCANIYAAQRYEAVSEEESTRRTTLLHQIFLQALSPSLLSLILCELHSRYVLFLLIRTVTESVGPISWPVSNWCLPLSRSTLSSLPHQKKRVAPMDEKKSLFDETWYEKFDSLIDNALQGATKECIKVVSLARVTELSSLCVALHVHKAVRGKLIRAAFINESPKYNAIDMANGVVHPYFRPTRYYIPIQGAAVSSLVIYLSHNRFLSNPVSLSVSTTFRERERGGSQMVGVCLKQLRTNTSRRIWKDTDVISSDLANAVVSSDGALFWSASATMMNFVG